MENKALTLATLNLTHKCNLACKYCFSHVLDDGKKTISFETAKKCVDFLFKNAVEANAIELPRDSRMVELSFWGGEPLLEWELLKKIAVYATETKPEGVTLALGGTTNATLLTEDKFEFLDKYKILFMISLDGTAYTHDEYRIFKNGKGSHAIIEQNVKKVLQKWPFYKVRQTTIAERVDHFYEDMKYLIDLGFVDIVFSPVYETGWTEERWDTFAEQGKKVVDLIIEQLSRGKRIKIGHFETYCSENTKNAYSCGAGKGYFGIDIDGSFWPCHRFIKFDDQRPWQEKEMCFGHVDYGVTKPEVRNLFFVKGNKYCIDCLIDTKNNCIGGCYAANFDIMGEISKIHANACLYVKAQRKISDYCIEKGVYRDMNEGKSCTCYNLVYTDERGEEISEMDNSGITCHCNNACYNGDPDSAKVTRPLIKVPVNPARLVKDIEALKGRMDNIENKLDLILNKLGG